MNLKYLFAFFRPIMLSCTGAEIAIIGAVVGSTAVSYSEQKKSRKQAEQEHARTMAAQVKSQEEADTRDKARRMNIDTSESATTAYGTDQKTRKKQVASDLLISRTTSSFGSGSGSGRVGLGF